MAWPTPQDYNEAVQAPKVVFADPELKGAMPETTKLGLPKAITGNFACVYRFSRSNKEWAVRCFHRRYAGRRNRYAQISHTLAGLGLPYTVPFDYVDEGIRLRGQWYPILKMEWVRGLLLHSYIEENIAKPKVIDDLAAKWKKMMADLRGAGIAHGDLQHGNVLVVKGELRLVDYDGMYVPALAGLRSNEAGHPNYQHPHRMGSHYGPYLDNFSAWVVYVSLVALASDPTLWEKTTRGDEALIFRKRDFEFPAQSRAFALLKSVNRRVRTLTAKFQQMLRQPLSQIPSLDEKPPARPAAVLKPAAVPPAAAAAPKAAPPAAAPRPAAPAAAPKPPPPPPPTAPPAKPLPGWVQAAAPARPAPVPAAPAGPAARPARARPRPAPSRTAATRSSVPITRFAPSRGARAALAVLAGLWWVVRAFARAGYHAARLTLVGTWWLLRRSAVGGYVVLRAVLWRAPRYSFSAVGRSYRKLSPMRRRWVWAGVAVILVSLSASSLAWYYVLWRPAAAGPHVPAVDPAVGEELCEFLARPVASLYIDGELAAEEIPPLYRAALSVGRHTVRFVGPEGESREETITVTKGRPRMWVMNFVEGRMRSEPTGSPKE